MRNFMILLMVGMAGFAIASGDLANAGGPCCAHCRCEAPCQKVCRLVKEEKKVDVVCWGCKCEDFCLPKPSSRCCEHCETACLEDGKACSPDSPCAKPKNFVWTEWMPGCGAHIHTKKKLMKKVVTKKIPSFKWVVEDLCTQCESNAVAASFEPDAAIPLPPTVDAKLLVGPRSE